MPLSLKRFWWCLIGIFFPDNTRKRRRFFVFREDSPKMCRRTVVVASKRLSLSLSRGGEGPNKGGFQKGAKKYAKNVFVSKKNISLYGVQQPQRASRGCARSNTYWTWCVRDGFESVGVRACFSPWQRRRRGDLLIATPTPPKRGASTPGRRRGKEKARPVRGMAWRSHGTDNDSLGRFGAQ